ncbi:MAG TPA: cell envelope biogenesis protein OmpA, partial [Flavobacteriales bacterium]|nr:cell envelope biogenesis protein OmpA [Flavobacteriales bacterium]
MGYYKTIDGNKYDGELLELADKLTSGSGDGRISQADAGQLLEAVKDGDSYTDIEK